MKHIVIILIILLLYGCSTLSITPVCSHKAVLTALTAGEVYKVRMAWGKNKNHWQPHVQAQAFVDGKWMGLRLVNDKVIVSDMDNYEIWQYMTVKEYIDFEWKTGVK
jgi:uncharacterized protein YceK